MLRKVCLGHDMVWSGGVGLITFLGTCIWLVLRSQITKYAATLADVANVPEHKFHGIFIFLFAKLAHALGATLASGLCCDQIPLLL